MSGKKEHSALLIKVSGLVQGVGFRPFIYRIAHQHGITGWVENRNDGVRILAEGAESVVRSFITDIRREAPVASVIRSISFEHAVPEGHTAFTIIRSGDSSSEITDISPDIAVCEECLADMKSQPNRIDYPFINCTNCGPRFTIISDLPYDREQTTMKEFVMCPQCRSEYINVLDRRFHAQPVACNDCGPHYTMFTGGLNIRGTKNILLRISEDIKSGKILAIKGLGGFHLACDAFNDEAAKALRSRKNREGKPFAVMFHDIVAVEKHLELSGAEKRELLSWRRPIVILKNRPTATGLATAVSNGFDTTGTMLPYMPFHYLLFEHLQTDAIVLTSGNISDEPILIDNELALSGLSGVADAFVTYNRKILNRTDDSVTMIVNEKPRLLRRSRGYVPSPVETGLLTEGIFAAGSELVNCFGIGKGQQAIISQHIGDLKNLETLDFYQEAFHRFSKMFRFSPELLAIDMHPDYLSRKFSMELAASHPRLAITEIQHHHAHIAACMAEHGLDEEVIGISLDGVGYGTDGNIWGFEVMTCDLLDFQREIHAEYVPQPGGDLATKEPWRMAISYLYKEYGEAMWDLKLPLFQADSPENLSLLLKTIDKRINAPLSCSAGRLFDAVAALTGICTHSDFHAEAPMRLEQAITPGIQACYSFDIDNQFKFGKMFREICEEMAKGIDTGVISAKFHNTVIECITQGTDIIAKNRNLSKVVLSGGTFQNRYLLSHLEIRLQSAGFHVFSHSLVPSNDGGIALGQLVVAAKRRSAGRI